MKPIVADSSPFISLFRIKQIELLPQLFERIFIPPAVAAELFHPDKPGGSFFPSADWIEVVELEADGILNSLNPDLGSGERQAIALAHQLNLDLLVDDGDARNEAERFHIETLGTIGLLVYAKNENLVPHVQPLLDDLIRNGFWISKRLYNQVLEIVGEANSR